MTWHLLTELPKPDTEVLVEVEGFTYATYAILMYDGYGNWLQHLPPMGNALPEGGWCGTAGLTVKRWAYIEED